jgi:hypothetical protein
MCGRVDLALGKVPGADVSQLLCHCPFNHHNVTLPCVGEQGSTEEGGLAVMVVRESSGTDKSSFVRYCPFNSNVMCVGEQGSTEEGGLAVMVVRESSGIDKSSFVRYCPFNSNVMCVGEQGSTEEGGRADLAVRESSGGRRISVRVLLSL